MADHTRYTKQAKAKATIGEASALAQSAAQRALNHVVILARWAVLISLVALLFSAIAWRIAMTVRR